MPASTVFKGIVPLAMSAAAASLVMPEAARAQTRPGFEVGAEILDYNFRERDGGATIVRDDGTMSGLRVSYVETIGRGFFVRGLFTGVTGEVDYRSDDGSQLDDVDQRLGLLEVHAGKDFDLGGVTVTAFAGLGVRALVDESGGRTTADGVAGYDREVGYGYVPIGIGAGVPLGASRLLLSAQYNKLFVGNVRSELSDVDRRLPNVDAALRGGDGFDLSATLAIPVGRREIRFGPAFRRWSVARSERRSFTIEDMGQQVEVEFFEPRNRTSEYVLRVSFAF